MSSVHGAQRRFSWLNYLRLWGPLVLGLCLFVASLPLYEAWQSRDVLGRWSREYVLFSLACAIGLLVLVVATVKHSLASRASSEASPASVRALGAAVFLWGASYLMSALHSHSAAGRILELNVLGTTFPPSVLLSWFALALAALALGLWIVRTLPPRWHNLALVVGTVIGMLILGEGIARVRALIAPETQGFPTYTAALWERRYVELNHLGFRDIEHVPQKIDGMRRLLVVGDSYAFGVGIAGIRDRFGEQLAPRLDIATGARWEPINAGVPDTHTLQHLETLELMHPYGPDLVVLLYVFNDIDYLVPVTPRPGILGRGGLLQRLRPFRLLFLNSYLFQELYVRWRKVAPGFTATAPPSDPYLDAGVVARHMDDLTRFVDGARDAGASAAIVPFDNQHATGGAQGARYRAFMRAAEGRGLPLCEIAGAIASREPAALRVNSLDGHPNELANRLAAEAAVACLAASVASGKRGAR